MEQKINVSTVKDSKNLLELTKKAFRDKIEAIKLEKDEIVITIPDEADFKEKFSLIQSVFSFIKERQALESMAESI